LPSSPRLRSTIAFAQAADRAQRRSPLVQGNATSPGDWRSACLLACALRKSVAQNSFRSFLAFSLPELQNDLRCLSSRRRTFPRASLKLARSPKLPPPPEHSRP